jgi:hypothetical protein
MNTDIFIKPTQTLMTRATGGAKRLGQLETWTYGLLNAAIMGGSTSVTAWFGMTAAKGVGMDVPVLNFKSLGVIFVSGAAVKFFAYLSQGLPILVTNDTPSTPTDTKP